MRLIIPTLAGLVALTAVSVQAAPVPTNPHPHSKWRETPAQNVVVRAMRTGIRSMKSMDAKHARSNLLSTEVTIHDR
jgi:hypothetical protein